MAAPGTNHQSTRVMAYLLDITPRRLGQLADEGIIRPVKRNVWDLVETLHGYVRYLRDGAIGAGDEDSTLESRREKVRLLKAQADKAELEASIMRGDTIPADVVQDVVGGMVAAFRARMLALPSRAAAQVLACADYQAAEELLRELTYEALNELADFDPEQFLHERSRPAHLLRGDQDRSAAAESDRQRMGGSQPDAQPRKQRRTRKVGHQPGAVSTGDDGRGA